MLAKNCSGDRYADWVFQREWCLQHALQRLPLLYPLRPCRSIYTWFVAKLITSFIALVIHFHLYNNNLYLTSSFFHFAQNDGI